MMVLQSVRQKTAFPSLCFPPRQAVKSWAFHDARGLVKILTTQHKAT
jgi:hypothetical protein